MTHPLQGSILSLRKAGWSYGRIAQRLGVTRSVVAGVLVRSGSARPKVETTTWIDQRWCGGRSMYDAKAKAEAVRRSYAESVVKVAEEFGVHPDTLYRWRNAA